MHQKISGCYQSSDQKNRICLFDLRIFSIKKNFVKAEVNIILKGMPDGKS